MSETLCRGLYCPAEQSRQPAPPHTQAQAPPTRRQIQIVFIQKKANKEYNLYLEGGNKHKKQESSRFDISSNRETCGTYSPHRQASLAGLGTTDWEGHKRGEEGPAILRIKCEKKFAFRYAPHHSQHRRARGQPEPIIVVADFFIVDSPF